MSIGCCAADAMAFRIRVDGAEAPARDKWVRVTGSHMEGSGTVLSNVPALVAESVELARRPDQTYE